VISDDIGQAFAEMAKHGGATLKLGARRSCSCILPDGIETQTDTARGVHQVTRFINVAALKSDIGTQPKPGEQAAISYAGQSYKLAVSDDAGSETGGAIFNFTCTG
jgi:hypothetical protein